MMDVSQNEFSSLVSELNLKLANIDSETMNNIASLLLSSIEENFLSIGRWDGNEGNVNLLSGGSNRWKTLSNSTHETYKALVLGGIKKAEKSAEEAHAKGKKKAAAEHEATALKLKNTLGNIDQRTLQRSGNLAKSIEVSVSGDNTIQIKTSSKYAAAQQFGTTNTIRITTASRKYFWAMYFNTGLDLYKGLALTKKSSVKVTIPASPFIIIQQQDLEDIAEDIARAQASN